ncbi:hypothetical protein F2Q68_00035364 [Brassica cretica]|uniref:Uncharacterized protein n=1 Tax=Brassica cretica TaxID=69181 RepID=A0A8S9H3V6_BRACR|nr:hypothetical protein F2Q68_00035364 [Brassica cretica]
MDEGSRGLGFYDQDEFEPSRIIAGISSDRVANGLLADRRELELIGSRAGRVEIVGCELRRVANCVLISGRDRAEYRDGCLSGRELSLDRERLEYG